MRFSRPRPGGGYDYFDVPGDAALGDDLPVPRLRAINGIGAASTEIGRSLPVGARRAGSGDAAQGFVSAMTPSGRLGKITLPESVGPGFWTGAGIVAAMWAGWSWWRR